MAIDDKMIVEKICIDCGKTIYTKHGWVRRQPPDYQWRCKSCMSKYRSNIMKDSPTNIANNVKKILENPIEGPKHRKFLSDKAINEWNKMPLDQQKKKGNKLSEGAKKRLHSLPKEEYDEIIKIRIENVKRYHRTRSETEANRVKELQSKRKKEMFTNYSEEQWDQHRQRAIDSYNNKTPEEKEAHAQKSIDRWNMMNPIEKHNKIKKTLIKAKENNNFNKKFEDMFNHSYISNEFYIIPEISTNNDSFYKSWDYGIYNKTTNELVMVVDLDGAYYHADIVDYDGLHSKEEYDERRNITLPDGLKSHIIYEMNIKQSFQSMIKVLKLNYNEFIDNIFQYCRSIPFPYPKYSDDELKKSWKYLVRMNCINKYLSISTNSRLGDRIITHFHPSIYHACVGKNPSPYDAWYNPDLLRKCIENRVIYQINITPNKILQGFNISKIAPKVSVFSAGRAKILIDKYLNDCTEIFDPFTGFGGRMLGTASLNKKYIGQDISDNHITENLRIVEFLNLHELISLECKDIFCSKGEYECLFTCPPYEDKEFWKDVTSKVIPCDDWIDICLKRFKCKKYLFVVDNTIKYKEYIVGEIINQSHFNNNSEKVVLVNGGK